MSYGRRTAILLRSLVLFRISSKFDLILPCSFSKWKNKKNFFSCLFKTLLLPRNDWCCMSKQNIRQTTPLSPSITHSCVEPNILYIQWFWCQDVCCLNNQESLKWLTFLFKLLFLLFREGIVEVFSFFRREWNVPSLTTLGHHFQTFLLMACTHRLCTTNVYLGSVAERTNLSKIFSKCPNQLFSECLGLWLVGINNMSFYARNSWAE